MEEEEVKNEEEEENEEKDEDEEEEKEKKEDEENKNEEDSDEDKKIIENGGNEEMEEGKDLDSKKQQNNKIDIEIKEEEEEEKEDELSKGYVALAVFEAAFQEIPKDLGFYKEFLEICRKFPFTDWLSDEIYFNISKLEISSEDSCDYSSFVALRFINNAIYNIKKGIEFSTLECFREAMEKTKVAFQELLSSNDHCKIRESLFVGLLEASNSIRNHFIYKNELQIEALKLLLDSIQEEKISEKMAIQTININFQFEDEAFLSQLFVSLVSKFPLNSLLWLHLFQSLTSLESPFCSDEEILGLLRDCSKFIVKSDELVDIWVMVFKWLVFREPEEEKIKYFYEQGILLENRKLKIFLKEKYFEWALVTMTTKRWRNLYNIISKSKPTSVQLLRIYVEAEKSQSSIDGERIKKAMNAALLELGEESVDLWLDLIKFEIGPQGTPHNVGDVYLRAVRTLKKNLVDEFIEKYTIMKTEKKFVDI